MSSIELELHFSQSNLFAFVEKLEKHQNEIAKRPDEENQEKIGIEN